MFKTSKWQLGLSSIIITLIVVVIFLFGLGLIYLYRESKAVPITKVKQTVTQSETSIKDKTATWKTYISTEARFMFKYPPNWGIVKEYSGKTGIKSIKDLFGYFINNVKAQTISVPEGWEIVEEGFYVTAAGVKANTYTVVLAPSGYQIQGDNINKPSEPIIVINQHQFNCYGKEWWTPDGKHIDLTFVDSPNFRWLPPYVKFTTLEGKEATTGINYIATCSKDPEVLDILNEIAKSFKAIQPLSK